MMSLEVMKKLKVAKVMCLQSLLFSTRYFFKKNHRRKFVIGDHHVTIANALERVLRGECTRLIINIAPRYGKTEVAVSKTSLPTAWRSIAVRNSSTFPTPTPWPWITPRK